MSFNPLRGLKVALLKTRQEAAVLTLREVATEMRCDYDRKVVLGLAVNLEKNLGRKVSS